MLAFCIISDILSNGLQMKSKTNTKPKGHRLSHRSHSSHCSAFVMERMPWEKEWTIRIVIPGIDNGGAVYLEATSVQSNRKAAEDLLDVIMAALPKVKREMPRCKRRE